MRDMNELLEELQDKIGYRFQNTDLLQQIKGLRETGIPWRCSTGACIQ